MKKNFPYFIILILSYLVPAFVNFDFNAGAWNKTARGFVLLCFFFGSIIYKVMIEINDTNQKI